MAKPLVGFANFKRSGSTRSSADSITIIPRMKFTAVLCTHDGEGNSSEFGRGANLITSIDCSTRWSHHFFASNLIFSKRLCPPSRTHSNLHLLFRIHICCTLFILSPPLLFSSLSFFDLFVFVTVSYLRERN